jgi:integrase
MSPHVLVALRTLHEQRKPAADDLVFTLDGKPWKVWRTAFTNAPSRAKIQNFRFHDQRHCFGSWLAMNGVPDKERMELMGHKDAKMTARYVEHKRQVVACLPAFKAETLKTESQQMISQREESKKVVAFAK